MVSYLKVFMFILVVVFIAVGSYLVSKGGDNSETGGVLIAIGVVVFIGYSFYLREKLVKEEKQEEVRQFQRAQQSRNLMGMGGGGGVNSIL